MPSPELPNLLSSSVLKLDCYEGFPLSLWNSVNSLYGLLEIFPAASAT